MCDTQKRAVVLPPGWLLKEELDARGLTQREFARRIGRPEQVINMIIHAKKTITPETSIAIGKEFGMSWGFWYRLSTNYEMWKAEKAARDLSSPEAPAAFSSPPSRSASAGATRRTRRGAGP